MAINVKPLGDRILARTRRKREIKKGGVHHPRFRQKNPPKASSSPSAPAKPTTTARNAVEVKKGDRVLVSKYSSTKSNSMTRITKS